MSDTVSIERSFPCNTGLTVAQRQAAVGKVMVADLTNGVFVVGGDATAAAGNARGAFYCKAIDQTSTVWTGVVFGYVENVVISSDIDISAEGIALSFTTTGTILVRAAGENGCGQLDKLADVTSGDTRAVFFDFQL